MKPSPKILRARDVYLNLVRVHERLFGDLGALFKSHGLSHAQFNVLRILGGGPKRGASCQYIKEHLLTRVPDVTRLVDRMEEAGLVKRERSDDDRRVVLVKVTTKGRRLCTQLTKPVDALHCEHVAHLTKSQISELNRGLVALLQSE